MRDVARGKNLTEEIDQSGENRCAGTCLFFAGSGFIGFYAFAEEHFDCVAPFRLRSVMFLCFSHFNLMNQLHLLLKLIIDRGNKPNLAVYSTAKRPTFRTFQRVVMDSIFRISEYPVLSNLEVSTLQIDR